MRSNLSEIILASIPDDPIINRVRKCLEPLLNLFQVAPLLSRVLATWIGEKMGDTLAYAHWSTDGR